jgi:hypothetical protein
MGFENNEFENDFPEVVDINFLIYVCKNAIVNNKCY